MSEVGSLARTTVRAICSVQEEPHVFMEGPRSLCTQWKKAARTLAYKQAHRDKFRQAVIATFDNLKM